MFPANKLPLLTSASFNHTTTLVLKGAITPSTDQLKTSAVPKHVCYLWYSVRRWVHKLGEVHHTFPLVLGDVDTLDWGEAGIGVSEVLQLQLPLGQPGPGQLHKHLPAQSGDKR